MDILDDTSMGRQNFSPSHFELGAMKLETSYSYNVLITQTNMLTKVSCTLLCQDIMSLGDRKL